MHLFVYVYIYAAYSLCSKKTNLEADETYNKSRQLFVFVVLGNVSFSLLDWFFPGSEGVYMYVTKSLYYIMSTPNPHHVLINET